MIFIQLLHTAVDKHIRKEVDGDDGGDDNNDEIIIYDVP